MCKVVLERPTAVFSLAVAYVGVKTLIRHFRF